MLWGRIFTLGFAYISRTSLSYPRLFSPENEELSTPPPCGFLIGIYLFYENWSIETFRKKESKKWAVCSTYLSSVKARHRNRRFPLETFVSVTYIWKPNPNIFDGSKTEGLYQLLKHLRYGKWQSIKRRSTSSSLINAFT
jgi:hypothetical protein